MNSWRNLFVKGPPLPPRGQAVAAGAQEIASGFITPQTLTSFPGAVAVVSIISGVITMLSPDTNYKTVAPIVASLIGIIIFIINVTDPRLQPGGSRDWFIAIIVGIVNTFLLIAAAIGVTEGVTGLSASESQ